MSIFKIAFDITLQNEGGLQYTNAPDDKGGPTFAGISRVYHPKWSGWGIVDRLINNGTLKKTLLDNDCEDYKALYDDVYFLYKHSYWDLIRGDLIVDQTVANKFYDAVVNPGHCAIKMMQSTLNDLGADIDCDGVVGKLTIDAINNISSVPLLALFIKRLKTYYISRNQPKYINGWLARAERIE